MKNVSAFLMLILLLTSCLSEEKTCDVKTVILEARFFPGVVSADPLRSPMSEAPYDSAERIFYIETDSFPDVVQQYIINFDSRNKASTFFKSREKWLFGTSDDRGPWKTPDKLVGLDLAADESHLGCGMEFATKTCRWIAQYKGYYVYLASDISENEMTVDIFANAVQEIEARMIQCLEN